MKIDEISEVTGLTLKEIDDLLNNKNIRKNAN